MALSPSHAFGQIIGDLLEEALFGPLEGIAQEFGLYLDYKHPRACRGGRSKVSWTDARGNEHDLDYVLEGSGSDAVHGQPKAFIEIAWRRYTKHSRNKAQEIQGAIIPLAEKYSSAHPFLGAILAGVFTEGSLNQLRSLGFQVLYLSYDGIVKAFAGVGIDARFDEHTPDAEIEKKVAAYRALEDSKRAELLEDLRETDTTQLSVFLRALRIALQRTILSIQILPLHGNPIDVTSVGAAIDAINGYGEVPTGGAFAKYELCVRYSNSDEIRGAFARKADAIAFLGAL